MATPSPETMTCMEVWGGNQTVDSGVVMSGLDAWVYCRPYSPAGTAAAPAGGDVYFVSSCATGRITRLLVADVSGHGTAVQEVASSLRGLMRKYVNFLDPCRFVGEMNSKFTSLSKAGCFATAVVTTFFAPTQYISFCNAGHPPPLVYRAGRGWSYMESDAVEEEGDGPSDLPLGIMDDANYHQSETKLHKGDLVLCYTDGLPESKAANGEFLGQEGLLEVVKTVDVSDPARIVPMLLDAIAALYPGNLGEDDITVLLFRSNGLGAKVQFRDKLLAPFRIGGGILRSIFPGGGPAPWPDNHPANVLGAYFNGFNKLWKGRPKAAKK